MKTCGNLDPLVHSQVLYPPSRPQSGIISTLSSTVRYYIHPPPGPWSSTVRYHIHHPPGPWSSSRPQSGIISILPPAPDRPLVHSLVLYPPSRPQSGIISILPLAPYRPLVHSLVLYPSSPRPLIILSSTVWYYIQPLVHSQVLYPFSTRPLIVLKFIKLLLLSLVFNFALIKIWQLFTLSFIIIKNGRWTLSSH